MKKNSVLYYLIWGLGISLFIAISFTVSAYPWGDAGKKILKERYLTELIDQKIKDNVKDNRDKAIKLLLGEHWYVFNDSTVSSELNGNGERVEFNQLVRPLRYYNSRVSFALEIITISLSGRPDNRVHNYVCGGLLECEVLNTSIPYTPYTPSREHKHK